MNEINFDGLEDESEWGTGTEAVTSSINDKAMPVGVEIPGFVEDCPKCRGTGRFTSYSGRTVGECFKCKGKGKLSFKTSPDQRTKGRKSAAKSKAKQEGEKKTAFLEWRTARPAIDEWLTVNVVNDNSFAVSLFAGGEKYGHLTEGQEAAVYKAIARDEDRVEQAKTGIQLDTSAILKAFTKASESGLKKPRLTVGILQISKAPDTGKNPGMLYIKSNGQYVGKVTPDGQFLKAYACSDSDVERLRELGDDFLAQAVAHGKQTGQCACCNRQLVDPVSVERGIGPICADRWGL